MIQSLFTIAPEYNDKPKFIWDISTESVDVFSRLAFRNIRIDGFVTCDFEYLGDSFMNIPIIDAKRLKEYSSAILIVPDEYRDYLKIDRLILEIDVEVKCYSDILRINTSLAKQPVYVFSVDGVGNSVRDCIEKSGISVEAFVTLDGESHNQYEGIPVLPLSLVLLQKQKGVIVLAITDENYRNRVMDLINKYNNETDIYFINELVDDVLMKQNKFFPFVDNALKQKKEIYLTAEGTAFADKIESILQMLDVSIAGYALEEEQEGKCGKSIFDLYYEGLEQIFVIVITTERSKAEYISNILEKIGLSCDRHEYVGIYPVQFRGHHPIAFDSLVNQSIEVEKNFPGVFMIGTKKSGDKKIVVLGGSTSTCNVFKPKSWVEFFYEEISGEIGDVTIYNMAHDGNDVTQELLRLLRDGAALKPDYVVSMSGVNNTDYKEDMDNQFNTEMTQKWLKVIDSNVRVLTGIRGDDNLFQFWKRNQQIIKAVSEIFGAKYLGVLQPMNCWKPQKSLLHSTMMKSIRENSSICFYEESTQDDFYINMLDFFWNADEEMYIDNCHYTTKANKMIAQEVAKKFLQL